jgi:GT2 family glycosyltransferase/glycosyltransferase involved in cell wall biosynthesis
MHNDTAKAVYDEQQLRSMAAASALDAVQRTKTALEKGYLTEAAAWAHRAHRLAPDDITVQILFASVLVHTDPDDAIAALHAATKQRPGHREAATAMIAALLRAGRVNEAASSLGSMLGRMTAPPSDMFRNLAALVCEAAAAPGWIAMAGDGTCRVTMTQTGSAGTVKLTLDGRSAGSLRTRPGQASVRALTESWRSARALVAIADGHRMIGSGLDPARFAAVEGFVSASPSGVVGGWARLPADPEMPPSLYVRAPGGSLEPIAVASAPDESVDADQAGEPLRWRFELPPFASAATGWAEIVDGRGRHLWGSPVLAGTERAVTRQAASALGRPAMAVADPFRPLPASLLPALGKDTGPQAPSVRKTPPCDVIVPIYLGAAEFDACLRSLEASLPRRSRLVLVNDGSPDPAIAARLAGLLGPRITVLTHDQPRGFPAAVNAGLTHLGPDPNRDVVILNADTLVSGAWLDRLSSAAHSDPAIGSCTPLTNDGTLVSYPEPDKPDDAPTEPALSKLNDLCWDANGPATVDLPTAVGFCMLMKGACLAETGLFREDVFAQGYGEENDWCLRAAHLGWRHVAGPGIFVSHSGGRSFGAAKDLLIQRNTAVLERLHPGYGAYVQAALAAEPLLAARRRIDRLKLLRSPGRAATVLITHGEGGGVQRHVAWRGTSITAAGRRPIVLSPGRRPGSCVVSLGAGEGATKLANLRFDLPGELTGLATLLTEAGATLFEVHHLLNHDPSVTDLPALLGVPYEVFVHDYGHWCPRISLTGRGQRYCGEPLSPGECEDCIADLGSRYGPEVTVGGLRAHSGGLLQGARRVAVSCDDVASRIRRQFPAVVPQIVAWEDTRPAQPPAPPRLRDVAKDVHVLVVGAIGVEKGYDVLLACARDAARRALPLRFTVVGHTIDDDRLMANGRIFVTGRFAESDGLALVSAQQATLGFVPSVCPETWCYALSLLWQVGLPVVAFALGAQGERIGRSGRGTLLPVGISIGRLNDAMVSHGLQTLHNAAASLLVTGVR